jgi:hypothetical protein
MLNALESLLKPPLRAALDNTVTLDLAPAAGPPADNKAQVTLFAAQLTRQPVAADAGGGTEERREPAFLRRKLSLNAAAGDSRRFDLPADGGSVAEVQSPPGHLLPLGDAYSIEPGRLQFLTAPASPLIVTLRGEPNRGYVERWPVRIDLDLGAWAPSATAASNLLGRALAALLGSLAERDLIELIEADPAGGMGLRLLRPRARLGGIDRSAALVGGSRWNHDGARVELYAEVELSLTLGKPAPTSTIRQIQLGLDTQRADGGVKHQSGTVGPA